VPQGPPSLTDMMVREGACRHDAALMQCGDSETCGTTLCCCTHHLLCVLRMPVNEGGASGVRVCPSVQLVQEAAPQPECLRGVVAP
jgi:hypothetical protein